MARKKLKSSFFIASDVEDLEAIIDMDDSLKNLCSRLGISYSSVRSLRSRGLNSAYITKKDGTRREIKIEEIPEDEDAYTD